GRGRAGGGGGPRGGGVRGWRRGNRGKPTVFPADREKFSEYWRTSARLLRRLPLKPRRNASEHAAAQAIQDAARNARVRFLRRHVDAVYDALTVRRARVLRGGGVGVRARRGGAGPPSPPPQ